MKKVFLNLLVQEIRIISDLHLSKVKSYQHMQSFWSRRWKRQYKNIDKSFIGRNKDELDKYKIFISKADGAAGQIGYPVPARILGKSEIAGKNTACTETFLRIGPFGSEQECKNVKSYIETKFFRCLVGARKIKYDSKYVLFCPYSRFLKILD